MFVKDRIKEYLLPYMEEYLFGELAEEYLDKIGMKDVLSGVPVPFKKTELNDLSVINVARSMAMVVGCDPIFKHGAAYKEFINRAFAGGFVTPLLGEGVGYANKEEYERACICFRGAMYLEPENSDAVYSYARACKDCYSAGEGEEYVGRFKAESLEAFEKLTLMAPEFEMGYYYLGYAYLNLGLYIKAQLTFKEFMEKTEDSKLREEVGEWIERLKEPVKIEEAYNHVLAGRYGEGVATLEHYVDDETYNKWWPLYYYLGISYEQLGEVEKAIDAYKRVLELSPSNTDAMEGIVRISETIGDSEQAEKYAEKIKVVNRNREEEKAEQNPSFN